MMRVNKINLMCQHEHGNISRDCAVHGSQARDNDHVRRESSSRKLSSSSQYSEKEQVERWRRSSGTSSTSSSTPSSSASLNSTQHSEDISSVSYQSTQFVSKKQSRPSFRRYTSFRSSLNEIDEEDEIEETINKDEEPLAIPFSFRNENDMIDRMGIIGLSSMLRDKLYHEEERLSGRKQENSFFADGIRKTSYNCHEM